MVILLQRLDDQIVDRKPDWTPPVRISAKKPRLRLTRLIINPVFCSIDVKSIWIFSMKPRYRSDSIRRQELLLIEHNFQNPSQFVPVHQRQQAFHVGRCCRRFDMLAEFRQMIEKPLHSPLESRMPVKDFRIKALNGKERDQSNERTHAHRITCSVRQMEHVIVEPVALVPEFDPASRNVVHRA